MEAVAADVRAGHQLLVQFVVMARVGGGGIASEVYDNGGAVVRGSGCVCITPVAAASAGMSIWSVGAISI